MNKTMYISLIVIGVVLIVVGVVGLTKPTDEPMEYVLSEPWSETIIAEEYPNSQRKEDISFAENVPTKTASFTRESKKPNVASKQNEPQTLTEKEKGNIFEGYVVDCFKDRESFRVLEWNQGVTSPEGVYAENNVNPDFHIEQVYTKSYNIDYFVEAKYLSNWRSDYTIQLRDYQIDRYRRHQGSTHRKVLLAIGVGGKPASPAVFYLVPLDSIKSSELSKSFLEHFATSQSEVKNYINKYFRDSVFKKSSKKHKE